MPTKKNEKSVSKKAAKSIKLENKRSVTKKASQESAKKRVSMKTSPRTSNKDTSTKGRPHTSARDFTRTDSTEQQTPLASFDSHVDADREMGVSVAARNPEKEPLNEKVKMQNKTAKNVSHSRSHSSQYRG